MRSMIPAVALTAYDRSGKIDETWHRGIILPIAVAAAELPGMQPTTGYLDFSDLSCGAHCRNREAKTEQLSPLLLES